MLVSLRLAKGTRGQRWKELGSLSPGRVLDRGGLLVFQQEKCFILRLRLGWGWDWGGIRRRCSVGLWRLRVEGNEQEKRELCFEKKLSHSCGGMPAVRVTPRLSPAPADTHPQGEQAGRVLGWAALVPARSKGQQICFGMDPAGVSLTSCKFHPPKGTKPLCSDSPAPPSQVTQLAHPREVPTGGSDATPCPQPHHGAPLRQHEPPVGL